VPSFSKLMKDAMTALERARAAGTGLEVAP
jgi:hypothetical protein